MPPLGAGDEPKAGPPPAIFFSLEADGILIRSHFRYATVCRGINDALDKTGRWDPTRKGWVFPARPLAAGLILESFGATGRRAPGAGELARLAAMPEETPAPASEAREPLHIPGLINSLWRHQEGAVLFSDELDALLFLMGMGCGKTITTIATLIRRGIKRGLVVAPKSVVEVWGREFAKHYAGEAEVLCLTKGSVESKKKQVATAISRNALAGRLLIVVVNYESAWRDPFGSWALKAGFDALVLDEIHRIKSPSGRASRWCARMGAAIRALAGPHIVLGLTGTVMPHSPMDLYAQFRAVNPTIFGDSFIRFQHTYAVMGGYQGHEVLGYKNQPDLRRRLSSISYQVGREVLDLPPAMHETRMFDLESAAAKMYRSMERLFIAQVEDGTICTAANALVKLLRLQQFASGHLLTDDGQLIAIHDGKGQLLEDLLTDLPADEPFVAFARFHADLNTVHKAAARLGRASLELSGRKNELAAWQAGEAPILAVQIKSGGVGVDFTRAAYAGYLSLGFSLGDYEQSLARLNRPGQTRPVHYYHLLARGTVDEKVYQALAERKRVVESILAGLGRHGAGL